MRAKSFVIIFIFVLIGCSEEPVPAGIYHYQVERLLSGQNGTKTWMQVANAANCADSVRLSFALVSGSDDSLDVTMISGCNASSNSILIGRASASQADDRDIFTDSLIFASGDFWKINQITSQQLLLNIAGNDIRYSSE